MMTKQGKKNTHLACSVLSQFEADYSKQHLPTLPKNKKQKTLRNKIKPNRSKPKTKSPVISDSSTNFTFDGPHFLCFFLTTL